MTVEHINAIPSVHSSSSSTMRGSVSTSGMRSRVVHIDSNLVQHLSSVILYRERYLRHIFVIEWYIISSLVDSHLSLNEYSSTMSITPDGVSEPTMVSIG